MFIRIYKFGHNLLSAEFKKQSDVGQQIRPARKMYCFNIVKAVHLRIGIIQRILPIHSPPSLSWIFAQNSLYL